MSKNNEPTPISVMLGRDNFEAKGNMYTVKAISLADSEEFMKSGLLLQTHIFLLGDKKETEKINRWLGGVKGKDGKISKQGYCFDENNEPVTLQKAIDDGWDVVDLKGFFDKLVNFSG